MRMGQRLGRGWYFDAIHLWTSCWYRDGESFEFTSKHNGKDWPEVNVSILKLTVNGLVVSTKSVEDRVHFCPQHTNNNLLSAYRFDLLSNDNSHREFQGNTPE
jgi:hypothetical protein